MKFHHIALTVSNYDEVVKFYKEGLGLKEKIAFNLGETKAIMLMLDDGGIIEIFSNGTKDAESNARWSHFCVAVPDVDAAYKKAIDAGATCRSEPADFTIEGHVKMPVRCAFVYGPAGEIIEFFKEA